MHVSKGSVIVLHANLKNEIYILEGHVVIGTVDVANEDISMLWHLRLGHVSKKGLHELHKQNLLNGYQPDKLQFCENCVLGKSKRVKFPAATYSATNILNYVHSNLWALAIVQTMGGARYLDDFSRKALLYLLKTKDEAIVAFKN